MALSVTPIAGVDLESVHAASSTFMPPFGLGTTILANDGHKYIYAKTSAAVAADTVCILTEPAITMATGAGAWTSPSSALASGDYAWFFKTAA